MNPTKPRTDEDFAHTLRDRLDAVTPPVDVDTSRVRPAARRVRRRRSAAAGAFALSVLAVGVGTVTHWAEPNPTDASVLAPASSSTATSSSVAGSDGGDHHAGEYWRVRTVTITTETNAQGEVQERSQGVTYWTAHDPEGDSYRAFEGEENVEVTPGSTFWSLVVDGELVPLGWEGMAQLPADPEALDRLLRESVRSRIGSVTEDSLAQTTWNLLQNKPTTPAVRDGLWEIFAGLPGSTALGTVQDSSGRTGTGVEWTGEEQPGRIVRLVYDEAAHRLLELTMDIDLGSSGHVVESSVFLDEGPVDAVPEEGPDCWEIC